MSRHQRWLLGVVLTLLIGCRDRTPPAAPVASTVRLPLLATGALDTLDPIQSVELIQYNLDNQIFEGLVRVDQSGELAPGLAKSWEHSPDYKVWRFTLRDSRFADDPCFPGGRGRKVTSNDVVYSLKRGLDPRSGSKNSWALSTKVVGASEFADGKVDTVKGLRAIDPETIEIALTSGDYYFLAALTVPSTYIVPREAVEKYGAEFGRHPVGSGPYKLAAWRTGESLLLARNANFGSGDKPQPPAPAVDRVQFTFFRSEPQVSGAFKRGEIDAREVSGADLSLIRGENPIQELRQLYKDAEVVQPGWILKVHLLAVSIDTANPLGSDASVRRALSGLFPRTRLERDVLRGTGKGQETILPPILTKQPLRALGTARPAEVLRQALHGREVRLAYVSSRVDDYIVRIVRDTLEDSGAKVVLYPNTSVNALFSSLGTTKPNLTLIYWSPYFPNIPEYLTALLSSSRPVPNFTLFTDERLDRAVAALRTTEPSRSGALVQEIDRVLAETQPWIPIYYETPLVLVSKRLEGYRLTPTSVLELSRLRLREQ